MSHGSTPSSLGEALWHMDNEARLRRKIKACQLWRTAPPITEEDIRKGNEASLFRLQFFYGIDLMAELRQEEKPTTPTKGDIVECKITGRVGNILWVRYHYPGGTVCVQFDESKLLELEAFEEYSSKWGRTRWFI